MPCDRDDWGLVTMTDATNTDSATDTALTDVAKVEGSPEALGENGKKALEAERGLKKQAEQDAKAAKAEAAALAARLKEFEDRDKTAIDKAAEAAAQAAKERDEAVTELLRYKVAEDKKLPPESVGLLSGTTREELEAKADSILALLEGSKPKGGPVVPAEGKAPANISDEEAQARHILLGLN